MVPASDKCKVLVLGRWKGVLQQEDIPLQYLKITDHLDYLGVKLYSDYTSTRKENGELLKKKVKDQIGSWKAGKFLPLTSRPWSLNCYCLSKLWYKASCLDLRVGDSDTITSSVKGWMYQDMLLKPQEVMLYRAPGLGGLGLYNVKTRCIAMLIHTFLLQAVSPLFPTNFYLNTLFRWHVLDERVVPDPGRPPYYSVAFFSIIKDVHENTPLNVKWISVKQWCQLLLERGVTHNSEDQDSPASLIPSRLEESSPGTDFSNSYRMARIFGLSPDQKSFLFKMTQNLLPTRERLHRVGKAASPACTFCDEQQDTIAHLLACPHSTQVSTPLMACLSSQAGTLTYENITTLNFTTSESWELPAAWLVATCLNLIWEDRVVRRVSSLIICRAELQARISLLGSTKWKHYSLHNSVVLLDEAINLHFL